jgi:phage gpG-like protein
MIRSLTDAVSYFGRLAFRSVGLPTRAIEEIREAPELVSTESSADSILLWFRTMLGADIYLNFARAESPTGMPWAPVRYPAREGSSPLVDTGALLQGADTGATTLTQWMGGDLVSTMREPSYWPYHQFGTAHIPARPFFGARLATLQELAGRMCRSVATLIIKSEK